MKSEVWLNIIRPLIFLFCIIGIATFSSSLDAEVMLLAHLLALLLSLILILTIISPHFGSKFVFSPSNAWREIFKGHRIDFWFNGATQAAMLNAPVLMFLFTDQPEKSAFAAIAIKISMIFTIPQNVFGAIIEPTIAADYKKGSSVKIRQQFFSLLGINFLLMTALLTAYLFFSTEIISTTVGEEYLAGSQIINIFVLAFYFSSIFGPVGSYLNLTGSARFLSVITLISIVVIFSNLEHVSFSGGSKRLLVGCLSSVFRPIFIVAQKNVLDSVLIVTGHEKSI